MLNFHHVLIYCECSSSMEFVLVCDFLSTRNIKLICTEGPNSIAKIAFVRVPKLNCLWMQSNRNKTRSKILWKHGRKKFQIDWNVCKHKHTSVCDFISKDSSRKSVESYLNHELVELNILIPSCGECQMISLLAQLGERWRMRWNEKRIERWKRERERNENSIWMQLLHVTAAALKLKLWLCFSSMSPIFCICSMKHNSLHWYF